MKSRLSILITVLAVNFLSMIPVLAQQNNLQYFRPNDKRGLHMFETPKEDTVEFDGVKVAIGGAFAIQFQALEHENTAGNLKKLSKNFNLPTANLDLDAQLHKGLRMHLRTFLSSRHHNETWVKGGYLQIDRLDFIKEDFLSDLMDKVTIKVGHMENNYGDAHFRRSDNAHALYNPFVGNYIMDSYTTEVGGEVYYQSNGFLAMASITNGRLNQSIVNVDTKPVFIGKLGYDKQLSDDFRFRLTGSLYTASRTNTVNLYSGDRAGARYYRVMETEAATADDFRSGRLNPAMNTEMTSIMINPFIKYKGLEIFGIIENASGRNDNGADSTFTANRSWTQLAGEVIYRFGTTENLFIGARYNTVTGQLPGQETDKISVNRLNIGGGWFMTKNILTKVEYVTQNYEDYPDASPFNEGKFNGFVVEAVIAF